jgi:plasmid maintenance system antidote protein VapI
MNFQNRLKQLIDETGKSARQVAIEMGVTPRAIEYLVKGQRRPCMWMLCDLADYFGTTTDFLLGRTDRRF